MEGGFSFWVANRGYHYHSKNNSNGAYETLAKIPLCCGRSVIAESVCEEWVDITTKQIPRMFWKNLEIKDELHDEWAWRAILNFSNNCVKRGAYQRQLKAAKSVSPIDDMTHVSLATEVPNDIVLSQSEAENLVQDRTS